MRIDRRLPNPSPAPSGARAATGRAPAAARSGRRQGRQRGIGMLGLIFVLLVIAGVSALTLALVPHYITHYALVKGLADFDRRSLEKPKFKMYDDVRDKIFKINGIYDHKPQDMMKIDKDRKQVVFHVDYVVQEEIVHNIGVYVHFKEDIVRPL